MRRRRFLRLAAVAGAGTLTLPKGAEGAFESSAGVEGRMGFSGPLVQQALPELRPDDVRLVVLHTNDTHSRMDPFPMDGSPLQGLGGAARRATLINRIRSREPNVLLLDSGDIFQGTPYFNFFKGEIEFRAMSEMGYDAATIGNHDFDNTVEGLVEMMPYADFPFVSANYDVSESALEPHVRPWIIKDVGGVKVGIFGLGIAFEGLVLASLHQGVRHTDPYEAARRAVSELRAQGCSLVVCLSHLGYRYGDDLPSDTRLAREVKGIDLILGGHTHTFMDAPDLYIGRDGHQTLVNQVGWSGVRLGRIDVIMRPAVGGPELPGSEARGSPPPGPGRGKRPREASRHVPLAWSGAAYGVDATLD